MRLLLLIFIALLIAVAIGLYFEDGGQVTMALADWTVHTSIGLLVFADIVLFVALYYLLRLIATVFDLPKRFNLWQSDRRHRLAESHLLQGLRALVTGNWKRVERLLGKGAKRRQLPLVHALASACAAQRLGALNRRDVYLREAHRAHPDDELAVGLVRAQLHIDAQQTEQALAVLDHLYHRYPRHQRVSELLLELYTEQCDWHSVLKLLPEIAQHQKLSREAVYAKQLEAYRGLLQQMIAAEPSGRANAGEHLDRGWAGIPKKLRAEPGVIAVYVAGKLRHDDSEGCEIILRRALQRGWSDELIALYGRVAGGDPAAQLKFAERFLPAHENNPALLLALGRLSVGNQLWGKARTYLQHVITIRPLPETYLALANVMEQLGERPAAVDLYKQGLECAIAQSGGRIGD